MEGDLGSVSRPKEHFKESKRSEGPGRKWPIALTGLGLTLAFLSSVSVWLPQLINVSFFYFLFAYTAPVLYILGVLFMYADKSEGKKEIVRFSTLGGITLIICIISALPVYYDYLTILLAPNGAVFYSSSEEGNFINVMNLLRLFETIGIVGSIIGSFFALTRRSFKGALVGSGLGVFLLGTLISPLAMAVIALGLGDFPKKEKPTTIEQSADLPNER